MKPGGSLLCSIQPVTNPVLGQSTAPRPVFLRSILIGLLSFHVLTLLRIFRPKSCIYHAFFLRPCPGQLIPRDLIIPYTCGEENRWRTWTESLPLCAASHIVFQLHNNLLRMISCGHIFWHKILILRPSHLLLRLLRATPFLHKTILTSIILRYRWVSLLLRHPVGT